MKFKTLVALALIVAVPALACAKKPKKVETEVPATEAATPAVEEAEPTITEECVINVSLFHESLTPTNRGGKYIALARTPTSLFIPMVLKSWRLSSKPLPIRQRKTVWLNWL